MIPPRYFRGPGGHHFGALTGELVRARGMVVAHWTADTGGWNAPARLSTGFQESMITPAQAAAAAGSAGEHQTLLLHDAKASAEPEVELTSFRGNTVAALPAIIDVFRTAGYAFTDPAGRWR